MGFNAEKKHCCYKRVLSVIIPVYNCAKYLEDCLESIIKQTFVDWELILVDDESDDTSVQICECYCQNDTRVKLIKQKHMGASVARINGIKNSLGDYITFVDSDDWMDAVAFEKLLMVMLQKRNIDIGMCSYVKHEGPTKTAMCSCESHTPCFFSASKSLEMMFEEKEFTWSLWGKIYKSELFFSDNLLYESWPRTYGDDTYVNWKIFKKAKRVMYLPLNLYHYRMNPESLMHQKIDDRRLVYFNIYDYILSEIYDKSSRLAQNIIGVVISVAVDILRELSLNVNRSNEWYQARDVMNKYLAFYNNEIDEQQKQIIDIINKSEAEVKQIKERCWFELKSFYDRHECVFIYGTGKFAIEAVERMVREGFEFTGYIVTNQEGNIREKNEHVVFLLHDVINEYGNSNIGIVTGLNKKNLQQVLPLLERMPKWEIFDGTRLSLRSL